MLFGGGVNQAQAAAIGFTGTGGWGVNGAIADLSCFNCVVDIAAPFSAVLVDGLTISGMFRQTFVQAGGATTYAWLSVTNVKAINVGPNIVSDNVYFFSDVFSPSVPGTAGVGIVGYYGEAGLGGLPVGGVYAASSQAQMNYLYAPINAPGGAPTISLTTPSTFVVCNPCLSSTKFWEAARVNGLPGGVVQLVGGINFTVGAFDEIYLPGSLILDTNYPELYTSEVPEPTTFALIGVGMIGAGFARRWRSRKS